MTHPAQPMPRLPRDNTVLTLSALGALLIGLAVAWWAGVRVGEWHGPFNDPEELCSVRGHCDAAVVDAQRRLYWLVWGAGVAVVAVAGVLHALAAPTRRTGVAPVSGWRVLAAAITTAVVIGIAAVPAVAFTLGSPQLGAAAVLTLVVALSAIVVALTGPAPRPRVQRLLVHLLLAPGLAAAMLLGALTTARVGQHAMVVLGAVVVGSALVTAVVAGLAVAVAGRPDTRGETAPVPMASGGAPLHAAPVPADSPMPAPSSKAPSPSAPSSSAPSSSAPSSSAPSSSDSLVRAGTIGVLGAVLGVLPWLLTGLRLPLQNLWREQTLPDQMPRVLLPFNQYSVLLLLAIPVVGALIAGLAGRGLGVRSSAGRGTMLAGWLLVQVIAVAQTAAVVSNGLQSGQQSTLYLALLVIVSVLGIAAGVLVLWLASAGARVPVVVAVALVATVLPVWLATFVDPIARPIWLTRVVSLTAPVAVGAAMVWARVRRRDLALCLVALAVLWLGPIVFGAVQGAVSSRAFVRDPVAMAEYVARVSARQLIDPVGFVRGVGVAAVIALAGAVVVGRRDDARTGSSVGMHNHEVSERRGE